MEEKENFLKWLANERGRKSKGRKFVNFEEGKAISE